MKTTLQLNAILIFIFLAFRALGQSSVAPTGDGSLGNPYLIGSLENLYWIAEDNSRWGFNYRQTADIDASETSTWNSGAGWTPIGNLTVKFTGNYDGYYKKISNLFINRSASNYQGFFGCSEGSRIENISLENVNFTGNEYTAGIVAYANLSSDIISCHVNGTINGRQITGGIVGHLNNSSSVEMCSANVSIKGKFSVGGLVGQSGASSSIYQCFSKGSVTVSTYEESYYFGGIVGYNNAIISNCFSNCNVVSGMQSSGGFVGLNTGSIYGSYSTGSVTPGYLYGGFAGENSGTVSSCYWDIETSGNSTSAAGTGKTSLEMKTQLTYEGWDFDMLPEWQISSRYFNGYPFLGWIPITTKPMVLTTNIDNVTGSTALITGEFDGLGLTDPTQHGFCWSTLPNPTVDDNKVELGGATEFTSFSATIEGLSTNTTYYVRAYATNSHGTSYGNLKSFKTFILAGLGTPEDPYQIATLEQLKYVADNSSFWSKSFIQTANIDATETSTWNSGQGWNPIGSGGTYFTGTYKGNEKTISGIFINRPATSVQGFFSVISSGTVMGIILDNIQITGNEYVGGLAGSVISNTLVQNCKVTGDISGGQHVGGIAGWSNLNTQIEMCSVNVELTGSWSTGGLVGTNNSTSTISKCSSFGNVYGSFTLGGAVGNNSGTISNSYSRCNTSSGDMYGGGFVGQNNGTISNCYSTGNTNGSIFGGFVEENYGVVNNCFWNKETSGCPYSYGGTGITSAEMSTYITFTNANWDFKGLGTEGIWNIGNARNDGFPYFNWEYPNDKALQEINFSSLTSKVYGDSNFELSASSTSGLTVSFTSSDENIVSINGTTASIIGIGDVDITASQAGNDSYHPALSIIRSLSVSKKDLAITAENKTKLYDGQAFPIENFSVTYSGFVNSEDESVLIGTLGFIGDATTATNAGSYSITPEGLSADNYEIEFVNGNLEITKVDLTITADNNAKFYDGQAFPIENFTATYSGFVNSEDESVLIGTLGFIGDATTATNAGSYSITPEGLSADNYAIQYIDGSLEISKVDLTISAYKNSREYGDENPSFSLSYSGFVNGEDETFITQPIASTLADATSPVGLYDITLSGGEATNYEITLVEGQLEVTKAPLTATAENITRTYGASNPALTVAYDGFVNGEDATVITVPVASTLADATSPVGLYDITLSGGEATNYEITLADGQLEVTKAPLTATAENKTRTYGASNPALTVSYDGFVNGEDATVIIEPVASTLADATSPVGLYDITLSGGEATNYEITLADGQLEVTKAPLTATAENITRTYGASNPALTVAYDGFVNGEDATVITEPVASTLADATSPVGLYEISLSGGEATNYEIILADGLLEVTKAPLIATAENITRTYGASNPALTVAYDGFVNGEDAIVITEPVASTLAEATSPVGFYDITLVGGESTNYEITLAEGLLEVTKAPLTVTADDKTRYEGEENPTLTISYAGFVNGENESVLDELPVATTDATIESPAGEYSITPSGGNDNNYSYTYENGTLSVLAIPTYQVTFNVTSSTSGAIAGVTITIDGENIITNEQGEASILLTNGTYSYTVSAEGFDTISDEVIVADEEEIVTITLTPVGVDSESLSSIKLYPNPFNDRLVIKNTSNIYVLHIVNLAGQVVNVVKGNGMDEIVIDGNNLMEGVYLIRLIDKNGNQIVKKVIKGSL